MLTFQEGPPNTMSEAHRHNDIELTLVVCGALSIEFGTVRRDFPERTLCAFWGAMPHRIVGGASETFVFSVTLPLPAFLLWNLPQHLVKPLLDGRALCTPHTALDEMSMRRWRADLAEPTDVAHNDAMHTENARIVMLELEARLRRMARHLASESHTPAQARTTSTLGSGKAERMAQFIAENFAAPLRVEQIARSAHVHPTYAMHIFREALGVSLIEFLTQRRIAHAQTLLATTESSIAEIAVASGFHTTSRFYAAFQHTCGKTPRAYRESLR